MICVLRVWCELVTSCNTLWCLQLSQDQAGGLQLLLQLVEAWWNPIASSATTPSPPVFTIG